ncbi:uncharacterized protein DFL_003029 [Arthrobotrys flagrans]|uniref:Uncharacterized protein n=1 Tax=Arthrobotrys flagrans TaxID=97331 RepID=A0A437ACP1_ARTFL|nr:hypothetical protein DFL_003029 [Arthrobotrys flagrans]
MLESSKKPIQCYDIDAMGDALATLYSQEAGNAEFAIPRVSSKVLSLVSPVFSAIMATPSEAAAKTAMNILHFQTERNTNAEPKGCIGLNSTTTPDSSCPN